MATAKQGESGDSTTQHRARTPAGRHKVPLGIRTGGEAWNVIHASIAAAALEVLARDGYSMFSIESAAAAAGVNKRTVYRHYPTKLDLALTAIRQMPTFAGWAIDGASPRERLLLAAKTGSQYTDHLAAILSTCIVHADDQPVLLTTLHAHVLGPREKAIKTFLAEGVRDGWARRDVTSWQVLAYINGLEVGAAAGLKPLNNRKRWAAVVADAVWKMIAVDPEGDGLPPPEAAPKRFG